MDIGTPVRATDNQLDLYRFVQVCVTNVINPRRACAARVTVVVLSFCLSVCLLPRLLPLRATRRPISDTNGFSAILALFLK